MVNTEVETVKQTHQYRRAIGVFKRREDTEDAIRALKDANFDMERVSLLAKNIEDVKGAEEITEKHGNEAKEGAGIGATTGTVLGGVGGFLVGAGVLAIPGVGPVLAAGVGISEIAATLAGAGIGAAAGGIIGALVGLGIPEEKAKIYEDRVKAGDYLLMVDGTEERVEHAASILRDRGIEEFEIYDAPDLYEKYGKEKVVAKEEVATETHKPAVNQAVKTEEIDLTGDHNPEVVIVDKRKETREV